MKNFIFLSTLVLFCEWPNNTYKFCKTFFLFVFFFFKAQSLLALVDKQTIVIHASIVLTLLITRVMHHVLQDLILVWYNNIFLDSIFKISIMNYLMIIILENICRLSNINQYFNSWWLCNINDFEVLCSSFIMSIIF